MDKLIPITYKILKFGGIGALMIGVGFYLSVKPIITVKIKEFITNDSKLTVYKLYFLGEPE